jgi:cytochrome d ubiquinol oxidase subunit II
VALAQQPDSLSDLTIQDAAAGHDTLVAVIVAVVAGAVILLPSLALLFRLTLAGQLGHAQARGDLPPIRESRPLPPSSRSTRLATASLVAGIGFLTVARHALGPRDRRLPTPLLRRIRLPSSAQHNQLE